MFPVFKDGVPGGSQNSLDLCPWQVLFLVCFCITTFRVEDAFIVGCASYNQGEINSSDLSYHTSFYNVLSFRIFFYSPPNNNFITFKTIRDNAKNRAYYPRAPPSPVSFVCKYQIPIKILYNSFSCSVSISHCISKTVKTSHAPDLRDVTDTQLSMNSYSPEPWRGQDT